MKSLIDLKGSPIVKGTVVRYRDGWMRVTSVNNKQQTVNIGGIFNGKIYHKGVPITEVYEDDSAWFAAWQKSKTYQSM